MAKNIHNIPVELYKHELPHGFQCHLYVGRMIGQLGQREAMFRGRDIASFSFEMADATDPTLWILKYNTMGAEAEELARWENHGDLVGLVIQSRPKRLFRPGHISLLLAYNFTRQRWFSTDTYPHKKDLRPWSRIESNRYLKIMHIIDVMMIPIAIITFVIGFLLLYPPFLLLKSRIFRLYKTINQSRYRRESAKPIADWITNNSGFFASSGNSSIDPSL